MGSMLMTERMLLDLGSQLAALVWAVALCVMAALVAVVVVTVREVRGRRPSPSLGLSPASQPPREQPVSFEFDEAA